MATVRKTPEVEHRAENERVEESHRRLNERNRIRNN